MDKKLLLFLIVALAFNDPFQQMDIDFLKKKSTVPKKEKQQQSTKTDKSLPEYLKVIDGMENVDKIKKGEGDNGSVSEPDKIISFKSL